MSCSSLHDKGLIGPCRSLYLHVPYCSDRCTYCAFATVADRPEEHAQLILGLLAELRRIDTLGPLETIYVGGGTPGILPPRLLQELLRAIFSGRLVSSGAEITLEVNPANVTQARLQAWTKAGFTRLSLGVQTFRDDVLEGFGRHHTGEDARASLALIADYWPGSWSADLLVGWASQDLPDLQNDLDLLLNFEPPHISVYGLTIEAGSSLARRGQEDSKYIVSNSHIASMDSLWSEALAVAGYERYEVSNFAQPGHRSHHNQVYWRNDDCLGLGPSASSSLGALRWSNIRDTDLWLRNALEGGSTRAHTERLAPEERLLECLGSGLRTQDGLDTDELDRRFSPAWRRRLHPALRDLAATGHLVETDSRLRIPKAHLRRADAVAVALARTLGQTESSPPLA